MGNSNSTRRIKKYAGAIKDISTGALNAKLKNSGVLEDINILCFIDKTKSNEWTGKQVFDGQCLHNYKHRETMYEKTFKVLSKLLKTDVDGNVHVYEYGSILSNKFKEHVHYLGNCRSVDDIVNVYHNSLLLIENPKTHKVEVEGLAGPSTMEHIVAEAIRVYEITKHYHIVMVITDGEPSSAFKIKDLKALTRAGRYPLSFVVVGVGDGSFDYYNALDDQKIDGMSLDEDQINEYVKCCKNKTIDLTIDNLQFVDLENDIMKGAEMTEEKEDKFFVRALMEVPDQYGYFLKELKYTPSHEDFQHPVNNFITQCMEFGLHMPVGYEHIQINPSAPLSYVQNTNPNYNY